MERGGLGSPLHTACRLKQDVYLLTDEVCVRVCVGGGRMWGKGGDLAERKVTFIECLLWIRHCARFLCIHYLVDTKPWGQALFFQFSQVWRCQVTYPKVQSWLVVRLCPETQVGAFRSLHFCLWLQHLTLLVSPWWCLGYVGSFC